MAMSEWRPHWDDDLISAVRAPLLGYGSDIPVRMALGDFSELLRYAVGEWEAGDRP